MDRKVSVKAGQAVYQKRQHMIEPIFGQIKDDRRARRFLRRGKPPADSEWQLLLATHILSKVNRRAVTGGRPIVEARLLWPVRLLAGKGLGSCRSFRIGNLGNGDELLAAGTGSARS